MFWDIDKSRVELNQKYIAGILLFLKQLDYFFE